MRGSKGWGEHTGVEEHKGELVSYTCYPLQQPVVAGEGARLIKAAHLHLRSQGKGSQELVGQQLQKDAEPLRATVCHHVPEPCSHRERKLSEERKEMASSKRSKEGLAYRNRLRWLSFRLPSLARLLVLPPAQLSTLVCSSLQWQYLQLLQAQDGFLMPVRLHLCMCYEE